MKPASLDHTLSRRNPWGLTPHQCCTLRLVCKHGGAKQVWAATDIPVKTVQANIEEARKKLGMRGHDVRLYIEWDRWFRTQLIGRRASIESAHGPEPRDPHSTEPSTAGGRCAA